MLKKNRVTENDKFWYNFEAWICYWRLNIHRFIGEYMGLELALFQKILVYLMDAPQENKITSFIFFASRGQINGLVI